ncbi:MAG: GTPase HflX [Phycisphaeraceae bacterium]|nr:MAG: GTPase HflX [Phycisphaeraceae bacterium]
MPAPRERQSIQVAAERSVLAAVRLPGDRYDAADPFGELRELAAQAGAVVVGEIEQRRERPEAGTYMGRGKVEELKGLCELVDAKTVIFDHELSPKQIAAIEEMTERKVLDRSELILDIFASRATTHEAKLQVEIAQLEYTYPRLRAMWDHLERIVGSGGIGGVGTRGPGEQQLEIDRRLVQRRKKLLGDELAKIQARKRRQVRARNLDYFTVGLVGYTNAGKSTLFNTLTAGGAYADDRLFATLMTRTREWDLKTGSGGGGLTAMLSDTVGFVRDLPHHLVASFRATLEEATHADLLLILVDISDPAAELHFETVNTVLDELFEDARQAELKAATIAERSGTKLKPWTPPERTVLLNKADRLADNHEVLIWSTKAPGSIPVCALPDAQGRLRIGHDTLVERVRRSAMGEVRRLEITVPLRDARTVHTIENRGRVLDRAYAADRVTLTVEIGSKQIERLRSAGAQMEIAGQPVRTSGPGWRESEV